MVDKVKAFSNMAGQQGMDLRDYFAAKALPIAFKMLAHNYNRDFNGHYDWEYDEEEFEDLAGLAYGMADAMMKAREPQ